MTKVRDWMQVGDLAALLEPQGPLRLLQEAGLPVQEARCSYMRLKPGTGALIGLELGYQDEQGQHALLSGYLRTHPEDRASELAGKWHEGRAIPTALGPGVRLLPGGHSVLFLFPNDARVRGLRFVADIDKLKRMLGELPAIGGEGWRVRARRSELHPVRYKPERRFIARVDLGLKNDATGERAEQSVFVRFFTDERGARIEKLAQRLRQCALEAVLPEPLGALAGGRLFVERAVQGRPLLDAILAGEADPAPLARALAELHAADVPDLPREHPGAMLQAACATLDELGALDPALDACAAPLRERLLAQPTPAPAGATLHGDCHLHQVLVTTGGIALVDYERATRGHPLRDLGHLAAHLAIHALRNPLARMSLLGWRQDLVDACAEEEREVDLRVLPLFEACAVIERALLPFRRLEPAWVTSCARLLELALATLPAPSGARARPAPSFFSTSAEPVGGTAVWCVFHPREAPAWSGWLDDPEGRRVHGNYHRDQERFEPIVPEQDEALPALAEELRTAELLGWRIGRRAMLRRRGSAGVQYVKVLRPRRTEAIVARLQTLAALAESAPRGFPRLPALLAADADRGVLVFGELPGPALHAYLAASQPSPEGRIVQVAGALAAFHAVEPSAGALPDAPRHADLRTWAGFVLEHDRPLGEACLAAAEQLGEEPPAPGRRVLAHGDLHDRNIVLGKAGVGFLDLDGAGRGEAADDLGNLAAHLVLRSLQAGRGPGPGRHHAALLLLGYEGQQGCVAPEEAMPVGARTLLRLACLYRFRRRWCHLPPMLLQEALGWHRSGFELLEAEGD